MRENERELHKILHSATLVKVRMIVAMDPNAIVLWNSILLQSNLPFRVIIWIPF